MKINYRPEIDGLRALAVFPVVLYHGGFSLFGGGFVGVDVFFVISGYLITTIILKDLEDGSFSLINFYERRARRILPALFLVIIFSSILSFIFLTRSEVGSYFKSVAASILFYSNYYFYKTTPYFRSESDLEPLIHTWSLSIEEQFYILFPLFLIFLNKYFKDKIIFFLTLGFLFSLIVCHIAALKTGGTFNFYFTLTRAWELALGSISAYFILKKKINLTENINNFLSFIGLFLILFAIFYFTRQTIYPSFYTLVPTIGTVLIILFANKSTYVNRILSKKFLVSIGLVSYSFYLWHQPLYAIGRIYFENFSDVLKIFSLIVSLILSYLSFIFIEKNFRNKKKINSKNFIKYVLSFLLILLSFSYLNINLFDAKSKNGTESKLARLLSNKVAVYSPKMDDRQFVKYRIIYENNDPKTIVVGSSRIMQIGNDIYDKKVLNLGVSGASIEDQITISAMALEKFSPNKIILSADPWLFNKDHNQQRWKSISKQFKYSLENIVSSNKKNKILDIGTFDLNQNKAEKVLEKIYKLINIRKLNLEIEDAKNNQKTIILNDGKRVYAKSDKLKNVKTKMLEYSMYTYNFSDDYYNMYNNFINYLVKVENLNVVLVLSPYHKPSYDLTIQKKPYYLDIEKKFKDLAKRNNIQIIGSYDSSKVGCADDSFYDAMHPDDDCMKKVINSIN